MKESRSVFWAILLGALTIAPASATDPNLLPNGDFSATHEISGWDAYFSPPPPWIYSWNTDDSGSDPESGSLEFDIYPNGFTEVSSVCFAVTPGAAYRSGGQSRIVESGAAISSFLCYAFSDNRCFSGPTSLGSVVMPMDSAWSEAIPVSGTLPADAHGVACTVLSDNSDQPTLVSIRFDNLFFESPDVLFASGFEGQG